METLTDNLPSIVDDRRPVRFWWSCALDNHEPTREFANGTAVEYDLLDGDDRGVRIETGIEALRDAHRSTYVLDDGSTARPFYVAGYHDGQPSPTYPNGHDAYMILHPFPVNPNGRIRPDNGRVIDYETWMLGPRRMYHLKVRKS